MITRERAYELRKEIEKAAVSLDDEDALKAIELFAKWDVGVDYIVGDRRRYDGKLYKCVQGHRSQSGWEPNITPALWTEVAEPGEIPVWKQPTGAQDAYNIGDKVYYPNKGDSVYESTIDGNVWAPDAYPQGWQLVG